MPVSSNTILREQAARLRQASAAFLSHCRRWGTRSWPIVRPGRSSPLYLEAGSWAERLEEERAALLGLVGGMENEFLQTGEGLVRLSQQLSEIQKVCQSLGDLTMGQSEDAAVQFAFQLLKKAEDLVLASYDQYDHVFATFSELRQRLAELAGQHSDLMRVLQPLHFITMSVRIEASRQPVEVQEVFLTLATDLNQTVSEVRATLEQQFAGLAAGERIVETLMQRIAASIDQHRQEIKSALAASRENLRALGEALANSGAGASDLSQRNQTAARHMSAIIMAQQCQDITRQKIEHVGEAMDEICAHLAEAQAAVSGADAETRPFVFHAAQIQLHQIQGVFDELNRAAADLKSGVESLRTDAEAAAGVAVKVGGTTLDAKVASLCQAGIAGILTIIEKAVQRIGDILAAFAPLQASFVDCTAKAAKLADDVRHAALNAQVFAIQAPNGATLEVLAERVSAVSDEAIVQVRQMGAVLTRTGEMVNNLRQRLMDFQQLGQTEQEVLNGESVRSRKKLLNLESGIQGLLQSITEQQVALARSVEEVLANVRFPRTVAEGGPRFIGFFQDLVAWGGQGDSGAVAASSASLKIDRLKANYTMATERHAHTAALQPGASGAAPAAALEAVELFGEEDTPLSAVVAPIENIRPPEARLEDQPRPADLPASDSRPRPAAPAPAVEKTPDNAGMGDNVELF